MMKSMPRYMAALQRDVSMGCASEKMRIAYGENGDLQMFVCDSISEDPPEKYLTENAYPNSGEALHCYQALWLSMFTRHMEGARVEEVILDD